jgi:short-subunit dehydrogenase involved in D-alanine esterification of teichoic acids
LRVRAVQPTGAPARRRQLAIDGKAACALGISPAALAPARKAAIESWTATIRAQMQEHSVRDPVEILPELLTLVEERAISEARAAAKTAAREEVQRMLRKVIAP